MYFFVVSFFSSCKFKKHIALESKWIYLKVNIFKFFKTGYNLSSKIFSNYLIVRAQADVKANKNSETAVRFLTSNWPIDSSFSGRF